MAEAPAKQQPFWGEHVILRVVPSESRRRDTGQSENRLSVGKQATETGSQRIDATENFQRKVKSFTVS